ncbi:MAG: hypothetical protein JW913_19500 [Chitinispirillaceae bacterium]|nr:hypothetical protein [Chitinispirillaceae bacterium]
MSIDRRSFIKSSIAGAAGLSLAPPTVSSLLAAPQKGTAWTGGMAINPDISNTRVVCFNDPDMCKTYTSAAFSTVNKSVVDSKVSANMDIMAMKLAGKTTPDDAWKTIFRSSKKWEETKVAIKVNAINASNLPRVAVVKKITDVLVGLGVKPASITLYDGHGNASGSKKYTSYASLTDATKIRANLSNGFTGVGGKQSVTVTGVSNVVGAKNLVSGAIDILVNIAVHRGHDRAFNGNVSLCLKNHYGSFVSGTTGQADILHSTEAFFAINKLDALVGGNPVRQQLCIIDSLYASKAGPFEMEPGVKTDRIVMGTFAGAVDYCCVKKIRNEVHKWTYDAGTIARYVTDFGFKEADVVWDELTPVGITTEKVNPAGLCDTVSFTLSHPSFRQSTIRFSLPAGHYEPVRAQIFDMHGSLVREISRQSGSAALLWDGKANNGSRVTAGNFIVTVTAGKIRTSERLMVIL